MSSNFLRFQLFCTKWWYLAPGKFFCKIPTCSPDIGARILALLEQKVTHWMKLLLWKQICVKNIVEVFLFSFSENMGWIIQEKVNFDLLMLVVV